MEELLAGNIREAVQICDCVRNKKAYQPALRMMLFTGKEIIATDLEIWVKVPVQAEGKPFILPEGVIRYILATNDDFFTVYKDDDKIVCKGKEDAIKVNNDWSYDAEEYPEFPKVNGLEVASFSIKEFTHAVDVISRFRGKEDKGYPLTKIAFESDRDHFRIIGTDGRKLGIWEKASYALPEMEQSLLPPQFPEVFKKLSKIVNDNYIGVFNSKDYVTFVAENDKHTLAYTLAVEKVDENLPDFQHLRLKSRKSAFTLNKAEVKKLLDKAKKVLSAKEMNIEIDKEGFAEVYKRGLPTVNRVRRKVGVNFLGKNFGIRHEVLKPILDVSDKEYSELEFCIGDERDHVVSVFEGLFEYVAVIWYPKDDEEEVS